MEMAGVYHILVYATKHPTAGARRAPLGGTGGTLRVNFYSLHIHQELIYSNHLFLGPSPTVVYMYG